MKVIRAGDLVHVKTSPLYGNQSLYVGLVLDVIRDDSLDPGIYKILRNDLRIVEWIDTRTSSLYTIEKIETGGGDNEV